MGGHVRRGRFVCAVVGLLLASVLVTQMWPASDLQAAATSRLLFPVVRRAFPPLPGAPWLHGIDNPDGDGNYTVRWDAAERANEYELQEQWQGGDWLTAYRGTATQVELRDRPAGGYAYRCRGFNGWGYGLWSNTQHAEVSGNPPGSVSTPRSSPVNAGGNAVVRVYNDSPYVLRVTFTGPEPKVMELPKCDTCKVYYLIGFCKTTGVPVQETRLQPGRYRVFVTASDPSVRPYLGVWELAGDRLYPQPFCVVRSFGSTGVNLHEHRFCQ